MDTNITETGGRINRLFWASVEEAHKTGIFKYPLLCLLTILFFIAFAIQLCTDGLLKLVGRNTNHNHEENAGSMPVKLRRQVTALIAAVLLFVLVIVTVVPKITSVSGVPKNTAVKPAGTVSAAASSATSVSAKPSSSGSQSSKQKLWLDTPSCTLGISGSYQFLLKSKVSGPVTVKPQDSSYVKVNLSDSEDNRGRLYTISGQKVGSTFITVESNDLNGSFPVTVTKSSITIDTTSYMMPQSGVYDIKALLTGIDKNGGEKLDVASTDTKIATVVRKAAGLYQVTGHKEGECEIVFQIGGMRVSSHIAVQAGANPHGDSTRVVDTL